MKILFVNNQAKATHIFWSTLIKCMPSTEPTEDIKKLHTYNVRVIKFSLNRKGLNPLKDLKSIFELYKILRLEKPDLVFTSTIKPTVYGNIAARLACVSRVFSCITGLGIGFENSNKLSRKLLHNVVKLLYKISLRSTKCIFFQNTADKEIFLAQGLISKYQNTAICMGCGVDLEYFSVQKNTASSYNFLMIARLLEAKGILDFAQAAKIIQAKYPHVNFNLLGAKEYGLGALSVEQLKECEKYINYLGETQDVRPYIANASAVVLPSWREGLSTALMEAMSMGRPVIASNVAGCKELVRDGVNGFLVPLKDPKALANAIERIILEPQLAYDMGLNSRRMAEDSLDAKKVALQIMQEMNL